MAGGRGDARNYASASAPEFLLDEILKHLGKNHGGFTISNVHRLDDAIISGGVPAGDAAWDELARHILDSEVVYCL